MEEEFNLCFLSDRKVKLFRLILWSAIILRKPKLEIIFLQINATNREVNRFKRKTKNISKWIKNKVWLVDFG